MPGIEPVAILLESESTKDLNAASPPRRYFNVTVLRLAVTEERSSVDWRFVNERTGDGLNVGVAVMVTSTYA